LCAFAINQDGADKLSSAPPLSKFLDPPLIALAFFNMYVVDAFDLIK